MGCSMLYRFLTVFLSSWMFCSLRLYDLSAARHSQNSDIVNMIKPVLIVCQRDPSARNSGASVVGEDEGALEKP